MINKTPWFLEEAGFYGPDYLMEYEGILSEQRTALEVSFIEKALKLSPGSRILDVPCGHGRHSIEFARRGYSVTGSDLNRFFINEAQKEAKKVKVDVRFLQSDMRKLSFDSEFDIALNLFTSLGHFDCDQEDITFLSAVYSALKPGGHFLLDFVNKSWLTKSLKLKDWRKLSDNSIVLIERRYEDISSRKIEERTRVRSGKVEVTTSISQRIYSANELVSMGNAVGFEISNAYGDFQGIPLTQNSQRAILVFQK